ncbi:thioesterase family protein [Massariosphaeria phaeospora]|uniref:Thioesterase family protein n=1 Tax=Massariosphaeria phaeospora TaxID=100035 RepID=A0A7C8I8Z3_9PLEO|nr:thioesterase family protein [Massariosphaeria phaeospora]
MSATLKDQIALQQHDSHTYKVGYSNEWALGPILLGGCVASLLYSVAQAHFTTTLLAQRQPDVHTLHVAFLRPCTAQESTVKVVDLKVGKGSSSIQLHLIQRGETKCTAFATSTDFAAALGPSANIPGGVLPALPPTPNFRRVEALEPDANWLPSKTVGGVLPLLKRMTFLYPVNGQTTDGIIDYWCAFDRPEKFVGIHLAVLSDVAPSMSDTLLRTGGVFDAHKIYKLKKETAEKTPGATTILRNSLEEAAKGQFWNTTLSIDMQFKCRLPEKDMAWTFTRVRTRMLQGGRMDLDLTICDEEQTLICLVRQVMLVLETERRFKKDRKQPTSQKL